MMLSIGLLCCFDPDSKWAGAESIYIDAFGAKGD